MPVPPGDAVEPSRRRPPSKPSRGPQAFGFGRTSASKTGALAHDLGYERLVDMITPTRTGTASMPATLVLCRHGQSDWNLKNLFTGWRDPDLTEKGIAEARAAGQRLKALGVRFDIAFTSVAGAGPAHLRLILEEVGQPGLETIENQALNERDYGDLSGLDKDEARAKCGEEQVHIWRRSYDVPPPGGESLKDTAARVLPYYIHDPAAAGDARRARVLVAAHGNSLRALIMAIEGLSGAEIVKRELDTGVPIIYRLNPDTTIAEKLELKG